MNRRTLLDSTYYSCKILLAGLFCSFLAGIAERQTTLFLAVLPFWIASYAVMIRAVFSLLKTIDRPTQPHEIQWQ